MIYWDVDHNVSEQIATLFGIIMSGIKRQVWTTVSNNGIINDFFRGNHFLGSLTTGQMIARLIPLLVLHNNICSTENLFQTINMCKYTELDVHIWFDKITIT